MLPAAWNFYLIRRYYLALFSMPIEVGDGFVDFKAFKAAMSDWSIAGEHKFTFRYQKPDKTRNIVVCAHADCSFRVYAAMNRDRGMVEAITANPTIFMWEL